MNKKTPRPLPAPILAIVHIGMALVLGNLLPLPIPAPGFVLWLGLGLTALGFGLGVLAMIAFRRARAGGLITTGVYQVTRNPVYLGFVIMLVGFPLSVGSYWGIPLVWPLVVLMNNLVIKPEEAHLESKFKKQFTDYQAKVRRWM
ncbi:MAG TPA: isoprenylcysteine carboxylmethyltransferase family protein [Anaerolineales bacterium]|nr:isoprenylcysteine carboxylmethyltransferase family protein [Anaerolineales bacterium]